MAQERTVVMKRGQVIGTAVLATIANLLLMGILLDPIAQWLILGASYPGAALVVGPILVAGPCSVSRAVSNRGARLRAAHESGSHAA